MTAVSKNAYFDVLDDIVNKYNNAYHGSIKIKSVDVKSDSYAEYYVDTNKKDPKFQVGDHVRISKHKNIFAKGYAPYWLEECFFAGKIKKTVPWTYVINYLNGQEVIRIFYEKQLKRTNQGAFRIEKVIKIK